MPGFSAYTFDTSRFDAMIERIEQRARAGFADVVMSVAEQGVAQVSNVPSLSGDLLESIHATPGRRPGRNQVLIVSDLEYAALAFAHQPPQIPAAALTSELADRVARELFG